MTVTCVAISADGKRIAAGALGGHVRVAELSLHESPLEEYSDYDSWFLQRCQKGVRYLTQKVTAVLGSSAPDSTNRTPTGFIDLGPLMAMVKCICFTPDGDHLVTASVKGIELLKIETKAEVDNLISESGATIPVKVGISTSPVSRFPAYNEISELSTMVKEGRPLFLTAGKQGLAGIFQMDGSPVTELKYVENGEDVNFVAFTQHGDKLVWGQPNGIRMIDVAGVSTVRPSVCKHEGPVAAICVTPDGKHMVTGGEDRKVMIWDCETGMQVGKAMEGHEHFVSFVEVTPDGRKIVSAGRDYKAVVWNLHSQERIAAFEGHTGNIEMMQVALNGKQLITGSKDMTVRIWDLEICDGSHTVLDGHKSEIRRIFLPQDESRFLSLSYTEGILWNLLTMEKIKVVQLEDICFFKEKDVERIFDVVLVRTNITECRISDATIERSPSWAHLKWKRGTEELTMATMDARAWRVSLSPFTRTLCVGLQNGRVSMLKIEFESEDDVGTVEQPHQMP